MSKKPKKPSEGEARRPAAALVRRLDDRAWDRAVPIAYALLTILLFAAFLFTGKMLFGTDTLPMGYAARKVFADLFRATGSIPLWNPYVMGGIPMVDGLIGGDMFYPTTLLQFVLPVHKAIGLKLVLHIFLAGWFFYLFARTSGASRPAAFFGGASYMFAPYIVSLIYAGHDGKLFVASLLPLGFFALERLIRRARLADAVLFAASVGLLILTAHLQLAFFACGAFGFRFIWEAIAAWRRGEKELVRRGAVLFVLAAIAGAALGAVQTYPAYRFTSTYSPRAGGVTYEFATSWSIHWEEAVSLLVPEFGHYLDDYWGKNPFKLNCESPGFLAMLLALAGLARLRRDKTLLFWYLLLLAALIYALGAETPFFRAIYHLVPKFFRAPSTILFLFSFGAAWIATHVLDSYWKGQGRREILTGVGAVGAFLLLLLLFVTSGEGFFRAWSSLFFRDMPAERLQVALRNVPHVQAGIALSIAAGALFFAAVEAGRKRRWPLEWAAAAAVLLVFLGNARTNRDFVKAVDIEEYVRADSLIRKMQEDDDVFRALSAVPNLYDNVFSIFGIEGTRGFFDNRIRWWDELASTENVRNANILNLLNVKYLVATPGVRHPAFVEEGSEGGKALYRNTDALPRAFLALNWEVVPRESMIARIKQAEFNPRATALVEEGLAFPSGGADGGDAILPVEWVEYGPNRLRMRTTSERPSLLVVSNAYLPYWRAKIDGEEAPLLRVDYALQGVALPAGEHEVALAYRSGPYLASRAVSLAAAALLLAGALASRRSTRKKETSVG